MKIFIYIFSFSFFYKLSKNLYYYFRIQKLYSYFITISAPNEEDINKKVFETKSEVIDLFKKANIEDNLIPTIKPLEGGYGTPIRVSCFSSYPNNQKEFFVYYLKMFDEAKGTFKRRMLEVFLPFYWIDGILFAPKNLLDYIGASPESRSTKISNVVLTSIYWFLGIFLTVFKEKVEALIRSYLP